MPYHYLEDIATSDIAFAASGATLEELFTAAADALLNTMIEDVDGITPEESVSFSEENEKLDILLFNVLNELVFLKDAKRLILRIHSITFSHEGGMRKAEVTAKGEKIDTTKHRLLLDVKAVTLHRLSLEKSEVGWRACVVLDV